MRSLLSYLVIALAGHFVLLPASAEAAVITSITGHVTGFAYSQGYAYGTNTYGRAGMAYDETLAPGATSLSAQARNSSYAGAYSNSSLSFTRSLSGVAFATSVSTSWVPGLPNSSADIDADLELEVNFTLTEATAVSLLFDPRQGSTNPVTYEFYSNYPGYTQARVTLAQLSGSDLSVLYTRAADYRATDPDGDGVFYSATLPTGDYRFTVNSYSSLGDAYANGSLQFSPVPEPAGTLLIALGLASFLRRRRTAD